MYFKVYNAIVNLKYKKNKIKQFLGGFYNIMKKLLVGTLIATLAITSAPTTLVHAAEIQNDNSTEIQTSVATPSTKIKLNTIYVTIPYKKADIKIDRTTRSDSTTEVTIYDKLTNQKLRSFTERDDKTLTRSATTSMKFVTSSRHDGPVTTTLELQLSIWNEGSFRQINDVKGIKIIATSSGNTTLEDRSCSWDTPDSKLPATSVSYAGSGTITGSATSSSGYKFSVSALESANFEVSGSSSSTYYYRKYVQISDSYSLY